MLLPIECTFRRDRTVRPPVLQLDYQSLAIRGQRPFAPHRDGDFTIGRVEGGFFVHFYPSAVRAPFGHALAFGLLPVPEAGSELDFIAAEVITVVDRVDIVVD